MDWLAYLRSFDQRLLLSSEGRRALTKYDPLLFAILYFREYLKQPEGPHKGEISFARFHLDIAESAKQWARSNIGEEEIRQAWVAPRGVGKSTWMLGPGILPVWALAHGHRQYVIAYADTSSMAMKHLASTKRNFQTNTMLRRDYPDLVRNAKRPSGQSDSDNQSMYLAKSGAVFEARGIDSNSLGSKVDAKRPDLIIFDDVEPDASNYSAGQKEKRLNTIRSAVFPMNYNAVVQFVGTVHMSGSIMDDMVRQSLETPETAPEWVRDEHIDVRYYDVVEPQPDGTDKSMWPQRWSMDWISTKWNDPHFQVEMRNRAVNLDGSFWNPSIFHQGTLDTVSHRMLSLDPAVVNKPGRDWHGIAVVSYSQTEQRCVVEYSSQVKMNTHELKAHVVELLARFDCRMLYVETNQGGDWVTAMLNPLPAGIAMREVKQSVKKEYRHFQASDYWHKGWVLHDGPQPKFEEQALAAPYNVNDDVLDAVTSGVHYYLHGRKQVRSGRRDRQYSYV